MRRAFGLLHRWIGLLVAGFLFFSGVTGAVISWDHELDELLNPHLTDAKAAGAPRNSLDLAREIETRHPQFEVSFLPLAVEPGHALAFSVEPKVNPTTGRLFPETFNQVFVDPADGAELGRREWGAVWPITRETFVSFLYKLHYSLHLPEVAGIDRWGVWLMGGIALIWSLDCFVGLYLTLPARRRTRPAPGEELEQDDQPAATGRGFWARWKRSWMVRWRGGTYRVNFDLHRAGGLWAWGLLFTVAFTAFSLNLFREVFYPIMSMVSKVTPSPFGERSPAPKHQPVAPKVGFGEILQRARVEADRRGWTDPPGAIFHSREYGIYGVSFYRPEDEHGAGGVGHYQLYLDSQDGRLLGDRRPWKGTVADIFMQAQFPLHSGRILGLPGRIAISTLGLIVAGLSVTGVYIWWRKRQSRQAAATRERISAALT